MKVTKDQLKKMINEEIQALQEGNKAGLAYIDDSIEVLENSIQNLNKSDFKDSKKEMTKVANNIHLILTALVAYLKARDSAS